LTVKDITEARPTPGAAARGVVAWKTIVQVDVLFSVFVFIVGAVWTEVDLKLMSSGSSSSSSSILTGNRLVLMAFVGFSFLRVFWEKREEKKYATTLASNDTMILKVSIDDYHLSGEDGAEEDPFAIPPIPERFINGCFGDLVEAERRWRVTLAWRNEFGTDGILEREHPMFDIVKQSLPAFYCGTAKDGNPVYYERSGQTDLGKARHCGIDWMVYNYVHSTEVRERGGECVYLWECVGKGQGGGGGGLAVVVVSRNDYSCRFGVSICYYRMLKPYLFLTLPTNTSSSSFPLLLLLVCVQRVAS
jgi:hypothetical protein